MVYTLSGIRLPVVSSANNRSVLSISSGRRTANLSLFSKKSSFSRKIFAGKSSYDSDSSSLRIAASDKTLVPGSQIDGSSSSTGQIEVPDTVLEDPQVLQDVDDLTMEYDNDINKPTNDCSKVDENQDSVHSDLIDNDDKVQGAEKAITLSGTGTIKKEEARPKSIPPPGTGQRIYEIDPFLRGYREHLDYRFGQYKKMREAIDKYEGGLDLFSRGYEKMGFTCSATGITYREWAPGAKSAALIGDFNNWNPNADIMTQNEFGVWEIFLPNNADGSPPILHGSRVKIHMDTPSGIKDSIPAWIEFSVQAPGEIPYNGIYYDPPEEEKYVFQHPQPKKPKSLRIYEAHVGMSSMEPVVNTYANFRDDVLPRIKRLGYNAVQIMAIQEHSYYGSFGYHVTNFFAPSSRCGTPDDLKSLIDKAHELGLLVLMDIVHR